MITYSSWNGAKLHGNQYLITNVLKNELGFSGFVVSDYNGIDQIDGQAGFTAAEVTHIQGVRIAPDVPAAHPAFDVTPARYIAAIFTERGVARAPYAASLRTLASSPESAVTAL